MGHAVILLFYAGGHPVLTSFTIEPLLLPDTTGAFYSGARCIGCSETQRVAYEINLLCVCRVFNYIMSRCVVVSPRLLSPALIP